jgi:hypothetical protein
MSKLHGSLSWSTLAYLAALAGRDDDGIQAAAALEELREFDEHAAIDAWEAGRRAATRARRGSGTQATVEKG